MNYKNNIGKHVSKGSITNKETNNKPFKSGLVINTVKGVITHPILKIPAYTFDEDDSYVECRRCIIVVNKYTKQQKKILKLIDNNPNSIIITAEQGLGKVEKLVTHEVIDYMYHRDENNIAFQGTQQECYNWVSGQGFGYQVVPIITMKLMTPEEFNVLSNNKKWDAIWNKKMGIVMWYCSHCGNKQGKEFPKTSFMGERCCSECDGILTRRTNGGQNMPCNYIFK